MSVTRWAALRMANAFLLGFTVFPFKKYHY
jgi:hypothetical protein